MKIFNKYILTLFVLTSIISCSEYLDVNTSPNDPTADVIGPELILPAAQNGSYSAKTATQNQFGLILTNQWAGDVTNFIADMSDVTSEVVEFIKNNLITFGQSIDPKKSSFVIVSTHQFDENLNIVPTMQEAFDYIEMEEIERQLDF